MARHSRWRLLWGLGALSVSVLQLLGAWILNRKRVSPSMGGQRALGSRRSFRLAGVDYLVAATADLMARRMRQVSWVSIGLMGKRRPVGCFPRLGQAPTLRSAWTGTRRLRTFSYLPLTHLPYWGRVDVAFESAQDRVARQNRG